MLSVSTDIDDVPAWVFSCKATFPNIPAPPGNLDHVFGGLKGNAHVHLRFDQPRANTKVVLLYKPANKPPATTTITAALSVGGQVLPPQADTLGTDWTEITYTPAVDWLDIAIPVDPKTFDDLLLAQVTYQDP